MPRKHVTLIVYRSDRNVWDDGQLTCRVIDLFAPGGPRLLVTRRIPAAVELDLDLPFDGIHAYGISVDASKHRSGWHVLTRRSFLRDDGGGQREVDQAVVRTMLVHKDAGPSDLTGAFQRLESSGSPFAFYGVPRFDQLRGTAARLAFLNLEAKLRDTRVGGRSLLSSVRDVREVHVDRVFLFVTAELRGLIEASSEFSSAPGHGVPEAFPHLPAHPRSWKHTTFGFGNLQLSFAENAVPHRGPGTAPEPCFSVDCDIDLERDLGHAFEWAYNNVFGKTTDQTLVYRMLWDQGILPAYQLVPPVAVDGRARVSVAAPPEGPAAVAPARHAAKGARRSKAPAKAAAAKRAARSRRRRTARVEPTAPKAARSRRTRRSGRAR